MTSSFPYGTFCANEHVCSDTDRFCLFDNWLCDPISENWQLTLPPGFSRLESFGQDELAAKHCYFGFSKPPDADGIKFFDKDDQAANTVFYLNVLQPVHLYQKF